MQRRTHEQSGADTRVLIRLPNGRGCWMPPHHLRVASGTSSSPLGHYWSEIKRLPLPGATPEPEPATAPPEQRRDRKRTA